MGICTLIAAVSCRQGDLFFQPTMVWSCGRIVVNSLLVVDQIDDKEFFGEVVDMFCPVDFDGDDLWWEEARLGRCAVPSRSWRVASRSSRFGAGAFAYCADRVFAHAEGALKALNMDTAAASRCRYGNAPTCGEIPEGARPTSTRQRVMLNGRLVARSALKLELEEMDELNEEFESWCDEYTGSGVSSCEKERINAGWEYPTTRHTGRDRNRMERDRARQSARRIKAEALSC